MNTIDYDVTQAKKIVRGYPWISGCDSRYGKVYFNSNEKLNSLLSGFDFEDKDILTVLASSDQLFYFYNNGANRVDTFDRNKLTIYYYYFRKWIIEYRNRYYPKVNLTRNTILKIISKVIPKTEEENNALYFWKKFYSNNYSNNFNELFILDPNLDKNKIKNNKELRNRIINEDIDFYNIDITKEFSIDRKYDYIYTSNIHDYIGSFKELEIYRDNLYNLLNDNGVVISSNLSYNLCNSNELGIFSSKFDYEILDNNVGYVYKKKEGR